MSQLDNLVSWTIQQADRPPGRQRRFPWCDERYIFHQHDLVLRWRWSPELDPPLPYLLSELVFWTFIARICTRMAVNPIQVTLPVLPDALPPYTDYFRAPVRLDEGVSITFSSADARQSFLTVNEAIWSAFEPQLRHQLEEQAMSASMIERTRDALLRAIPSANATARQIAGALMLSPRTLQRRLQNEGTSFKSLLNATRAELARHYLTKSEIPLTEISFLLGYQDTSSFNRAFRQWSGTTPDRYRCKVKSYPGQG